MVEGVGVQGHGNRVAGRDLIELHLQSSDQGGLLVSAQRSHLHGLIAVVADECSQAPAHLWRSVVHVKLGVNSINDILSSQFPDAVEALEAFRENFHEQRRREELREKITQLSCGKSYAAAVERFCMREFGDTNLREMPSSRLRLVVAHLDDALEGRRAAAKSSTQAPAEPAVMPLRLLITSHPIQCLVLVACGFLVGLIF